MRWRCLEQVSFAVPKYLYFLWRNTPILECLGKHTVAHISPNNYSMTIKSSHIISLTNTWQCTKYQVPTLSGSTILRKREVTCWAISLVGHDSHKNTNGTILEKETKEITFLDMDMFKADGTIHSKEHRKETPVNSYLSFNPAHPKYTFSGIVKSQLFRLRRLCSRNTDFQNSVEDLKIRCLRSGYKR